MSDLVQFAEELNKLKQDKILFIKTEPEIADFTQSFPGKLLIYGEKHRISLSLPNKETVVNLYNQLQFTIFKEDITLIFWNLKNLISYFKFNLKNKIPINLKAKFLDLRLIENFLGIKQISPNSLVEALRRLGPYTSSNECKFIHKNIHRPLSLQVVPDMETCNLVIDTSTQKYAYSSYDIEGQTFGRLQSHKAFEKCVLPHNMGEEQKESLKLKRDKDFFVHFDFKHMEVSMLQWLSKDETLQNLIESQEDVYKGIYQIIINKPCDTDDKRELIKSIFLPIMFGMTVPGMINSLSKKGFELSYQSANTIHDLVKEKFKTAWNYLSNIFNSVKTTPIIKDYFGRPRDFSENPLSSRGFSVQSPSAVFCLEKLISLHEAIGGLGDLLYSIHDGYVLVANQEKLNTLLGTGMKTLQEPSKLCPGLRLKVSCSLGVRLTHMKQIPKGK